MKTYKYDNVMNDNIDNVNLPQFDPEGNMDAQEVLRVKRFDGNELTTEEQARLDTLMAALTKWRNLGGYPGAWYCYPLTAKALGYRWS